MAIRGYKTIETENSIRGFFEQYRPLSNFHVSPFTYQGRIWKTAEHAFHAAKTDDPAWIESIWGADSPSVAKHLGRRCPLRSDWEEVKDTVMYSILMAKFIQSEALENLLLSTGDKYLEETNDWGDKYWGRQFDGEGLNRLGEILMRIRSELR